MSGCLIACSLDRCMFSFDSTKATGGEATQRPISTIHLNTNEMSSSMNAEAPARHHNSAVPPNILIADDHIFLAEGLAAALAAPPREYSARLVHSFNETKAAVSEGVKYDLIMLDIKMPGMLGLKSVNEIMALAAPTRVVLLSGNADRALVRAAVDNGARGLIPKTLSLKAISSLVEFVLSGQVFMPADDFENVKGPDGTNASILNAQEKNIMHLASEGRTNKEIAAAIGTSEVMIKMHMRTICRRLAARNRAHAVNISKDLGIL